MQLVVTTRLDPELEMPLLLTDPLKLVHAFLVQGQVVWLQPIALAVFM